MKNEIIAKCKVHWALYVIPVILLVYFLSAFFTGIYLDEDELTVLGAICSVISLYFIISYKCTYIHLTKTKIVGHRGFIISKSLSTPIQKVQGIGLSNGLFGKIFRYHTIIISNAGTSSVEYKFKHMSKAKAFVRAVEKEIENQK